MPSIAEVRQKFPQYEDMSDTELADKLYEKFYSDMPRQEFDAKIGLKAPSSTDALSKTRVVSGGLLEGIPVVGPILRGAVDRAAAATLAGMSSEVDYADALRTIQEGTADEKRNNPKLDTASQIGGAVAGTVPMVMAAPWAFGAGGGGLAARSAASAITGGIIGAADQGVRSGGDLDAMKRGGLWGAGLGFVGPGAGQLIGKGASAIAQRFNRSAPTSAQQIFARAAQADGVDDVASRMAQMGDNAMPMDLGPNLQRQAGAIASMPGRGQATVRGAVASRDAGANARIQTALDDTLGPAPSPVAVEASIRESQQALAPAYQQVFRGARPVDTSALAARLDGQIQLFRGDAQRAVQRVRQMLNVPGGRGLERNAYALFQARQAIDDMLSTNAAANAGRALTVARQEIDDLLARAAPGLKEVDAQFAELARQGGALQRGQQALDSGRTAPRPGEFADEFSQGGLPQGRQIGPSAVPVRLRQGARAEIERIVGTNANDRVALQRLIKGEGDWNRARLETLFGRERAQRIFQIMDAERAYADTSQIVTRNSETAARQSAQEAIAPTMQAGDAGMIRSALNLKLGDAIAGAGSKAAGAVRTRAQEKLAAELAELLVSRDPQRLRAATQMVAAAGKRGELTADQAKRLTNTILISANQQRERSSAR